MDAILDEETVRYIVHVELSEATRVGAQRIRANTPRRINDLIEVDGVHSGEQSVSVGICGQIAVFRRQAAIRVDVECGQSDVERSG